MSLNEYEVKITPVIMSILATLWKGNHGDHDLSKSIWFDSKHAYMITLTNEADFMLQRITSEPDTFVPLLTVNDGVGNVSEAIDIISRRIELDIKK